MAKVEVIQGDCLDVMRGLPGASVDAVVCDPPYELGFMGKRWDASGVAYNVRTWLEVLRVLKPGGHLLAFGGTRTYHRMTCAIEDAGFEIRDCIQWIYGSGFPKSLSVAAAIDKRSGVIGARGKAFQVAGAGERADIQGTNGHGVEGQHEAITEAAQRWQGWGTALKPANEPVVVARKPISEPNVAANVERHGTGAINIDGCRIGTEDVRVYGRQDGTGNRERWRTGNKGVVTGSASGRWPANVILDEEAATALDEQSGERGSFLPSGRRYKAGVNKNVYGTETPHDTFSYGDSGGASRFFYTAKASKAERGEGNTHPTVKPVSLMRYLCRLVTPPGGLVLDPFCGSGTTGVAALKEGFNFVGIEREAEYVEIARRRFEAVTSETPLFG